jgi:putative PIN family toxin of toxin-antitoxin system
MKVVVDTNIFIDAFFKDDADCKLILRKEHNGEYILLMNHDTHEELQRMLGKFINEFNAEDNDIISIYKVLSRALLRTENIKTTTKFDKCEDKDDNMFFECAIDGNADYIISKDKHIHALKDKEIRNKNKQIVEILYPDEFIQKLDTIKLRIHFGN